MTEPRLRVLRARCGWCGKDLGTNHPMPAHRCDPPEGFDGLLIERPLIWEEVES